MRVGRIADRLHVRQAKSVSAGGDGVRSIPIWAMWSIAVAALLSPVFALLMAPAAEILIGSLMDAGLPVLLPLAIAGILAWLLLPLPHDPAMRRHRFGSKIGTGPALLGMSEFGGISYNKFSIEASAELAATPSRGRITLDVGGSRAGSRSWIVVGPGQSGRLCGMRADNFLRWTPAPRHLPPSTKLERDVTTARRQATLVAA